jgi:importin subunit beta-1
LDGPSDEAIGLYVNQNVPLLLKALSDPNDLVKDTTAWTIGRVFECRQSQAIPTESTPFLVFALVSKLLFETPRVSSQACFGIQQFAAAFKNDEAAEENWTNVLSSYMPVLLETLLKVVDREDASKSHLRIAAYKTVRALIQNSAPDVVNILMQWLPDIINRLEKSFNMPCLSNDEKVQKDGIQGALCGLLQVIANKTTKDDILTHRDAIRTNLFQVLQTNATCHEEAFKAISAIALSLKNDFVIFMPGLHPFLLTSLRNSEAYQVCAVSVGLVGVISRAIVSNIQPFCEEIMCALVDALQNDTLHRSVKPPLLSCFGDIALAIGSAYEPYLQISLMMLFQAAQMKAPDNDDELIDYMNILREGILEGYTGIIQGLKEGGRAEFILPHIDAIMGFLELLASDRRNDYDNKVLSRAVGLIGEIFSALGQQIKSQINTPYIFALLKEGHKCSDPKIQSTCSLVVMQLLPPIKLKPPQEHKKLSIPRGPMNSFSCGQINFLIIVS